MYAYGDNRIISRFTYLFVFILRIFVQKTEPVEVIFAKFLMFLI